MMDFDLAQRKFEMVANRIEADHPSLREIIRSARESVKRIGERFRVDRDSKRADREMAILLLDLAEAADKKAAVQRYFPSEAEGGPPSLATLERVRAAHRMSMGIADYQRAWSPGQVACAPGAMGVEGDRTLAGDILGTIASGSVRSITLRSTNRFVDWILETFGGPKIDVEIPRPIGTVTIEPWIGDPVRAAMVLATVFGISLLIAWKILMACSCPPCPRRVAA